MPSGNFAKNAKGAAGVHLVVAQLSLMGYVALPTTRNLKSVDIVVFNEHLSRFAFIQVKSTDKPDCKWPVHTIPEEYRKDGWNKNVLQSIYLGDSFFYVFVTLPKGSRSQASFYVVPSKDVAKSVVKGMKKWLDGKPGRNPVLCIWDCGKTGGNKSYHNKWENLKLKDG